MQYAWIAFIVLAIIAEAAISGLVAIWFIPGALVSMLLAILDVKLWIQITVFAVITVAMLILSERYFKKMFRIKSHATNADAVIGQSAIVTEKICNIGGTGAVKVMGKEWTARSHDDSEYDVGDVVTVLEISGVKLICKK